MTYFLDLSVCTYFHSFNGVTDWDCRLLAVGWLEQTHGYTRGPADPRLLARLRELRREFREMFPGFRGLHRCTLCRPTAPGLHGLDESNINLFIPARGFVYAAPGRIDHYIEEHGYSPPDIFVEAVFACPMPSTDEYRARLAAANRGHDAPLFRERDSMRRERHPQPGTES